MYGCVPVHGCVHVRTGDHRDQMRASDTLELELQEPVTHTTWCWVLNLGSVQKQYALPTAEPSLQHTVVSFIHEYSSSMLCTLYPLPSLSSPPFHYSPPFPSLALSPWDLPTVSPSLLMSVLPAELTKLTHSDFLLHSPNSPVT